MYEINFRINFPKSDYLRPSMSIDMQFYFNKIINKASFYFYLKIKIFNKKMILLYGL